MTSSGSSHVNVKRDQKAAFFHQLSRKILKCHNILFQAELLVMYRSAVLRFEENSKKILECAPSVPMHNTLKCPRRHIFV